MFSALLLAALLIAAGPGRAGPELAIPAGSELELVFRWNGQACSKDHVPDAPARAFRDYQGTVHLIAPHQQARALTGASLDSLKPDCRVVFEGGRRDDPALFDDRSWLAAFHTEDGRTVHALVHTEFMGHYRRDLCPTGTYSQCLSNLVTAAVSTDGGLSFAIPEPPANYVAGLPYRYPGAQARRIGMVNPSNIVEKDGWLYVMVLVDPHGAQGGGTCLLRTDRIADAGAWRAFDGTGFTVRFADPYRSAIAEPARHVCTPIAPDQLSGLVTSLVLHQPSGQWIALMATRRRVGPKREPVTGIFAAASRDLVTWSEPALLWAVPILHRHECSDPLIVYYPSLIDPDSASPNFDRTDDEAWLYLTRYNLEDCRIRWNRDLVRLPVRISANG